MGFWIRGYVTSTIERLVATSDITLATRMAVYGQISEFDEEWKLYRERMDQYLTANGIKQEDAERCRANFISCVGARVTSESPATGPSCRQNIQGVV